MTPEARVKEYLKRCCERRGWRCETITNSNLKGWPDRIILIPGGRVAFIEVKAIGIKHDSKHLERQKEALEGLKAFGFPAFFAVGMPGVDRAIREIEAWLNAF